MKTICGIAVAALLTTMPAGAQQAQSPVAQPQPFGPAIGRTSVLTQVQGFNIVLVVGETQPVGTAPGEEVPPAARKALNDMRDFLPFKHYRIVDSQWTSCCSESPSTTLRGRLQGTFPWEADRQAEVNASYVLQVTAGSRLNLKFTLNYDEARRPAGASTRVREMEKRVADLRRELDILEDEIGKRRERVGEKHPEVVTLTNQIVRVHQRLSEANQLLNNEQARETVRSTADTRNLMDSNFSLDPGETVVVGTSKFGGDKALIAIVTAVRKGTR
jgi:hypothetical protein